MPDFLSTPSASPAPGQPLNVLFEGIPFASVRTILQNSTTLADILAGIATYKADPGGFETALERGSP